LIQFFFTEFVQGNSVFKAQKWSPEIVSVIIGKGVIFNKCWGGANIMGVFFIIFPQYNQFISEDIASL